MIEKICSRIVLNVLKDCNNWNKNFTVFVTCNNECFSLDTLENDPKGDRNI